MSRYRTFPDPSTPRPTPPPPPGQGEPRNERLVDLRAAAFAVVVAYEAVEEAMASEDSSAELVTLEKAITRLSVAAIKTLCGETAAADPDHHEKWETFGHSCIGKHLDEGSHECECGYVWNVWTASPTTPAATEETAR